MSYPVKPVEYAWSKMHTVGTRLFLLFVIISVPFLFLALFVIETKPNWGYMVVIALMANGVMWLLFGLVGRINSRVISKKLSRLRLGGNSYEVTIKQMVPLWFVQLGGYIVASVEGYYTDSLGNTQPLKSTAYVFTTFDKKDDFVANVYVDSSNPEFYAVELFRKE